MKQLPEIIARPLRAFSATRVGARIYRAILPVLDRLVGRLTGGRSTFVGLVLPTFVLTTTGRRSGEPRPSHLVYDTVDGNYVVVGTNWGQHHHPAWTHNLLADPNAVVEIEGSSVPVRARLVEGDEHERLYARFEAISPNYAKYRDWSGDREIRIFVLEPQG